MRPDTASPATCYTSSRVLLSEKPAYASRLKKRPQALAIRTAVRLSSTFSRKAALPKEVISLTV